MPHMLGLILQTRLFLVIFLRVGDFLKRLVQPVSLRSCSILAGIPLVVNGTVGYSALCVPGNIFPHCLLPTSRHIPLAHYNALSPTLMKPSIFHQFYSLKKVVKPRNGSLCSPTSYIPIQTGKAKRCL